MLREVRRYKNLIEVLFRKLPTLFGVNFIFQYLAASSGIFCGFQHGALKHSRDLLKNFAKMSAICSDGPTPELFRDWIHANFLGNNRTKTITAEKYARICRYMLGDYTCTNAKFRYWVKSKGFHVVHTGVGRNYKGNELLIRYHPKRRDVS